MTEKLAIATCPDFPTLADDDRGLLRCLSDLGIDAEPVLWQADVDWGSYAAVLLRSVWDYYLHAPAFAAWLGRLDRERVPCWNPTSLVRWNLDKRYLRELAARGIPTVPTLWIEPAGGLTPETVASRIRETGWDDLVIKPTVSASAWRTLHLRTDELLGRAEPAWDVRAGGAWMAQPFMPEILDEGEYSLLFFEGAFSHAVLKRARPGDFRVQAEHGGSQAPVTPSAPIVDQARAALLAAPSSGLYARVDGVVRDGRLILMELELIEPFLYFA